jgi:predicted O-methyltransferase YrrM
VKIHVESDHLILSIDDGKTKIPLFSMAYDALLCNLTPQEILDNFLKIFNRYAEIAKYTYGQTTSLDILALMSLLFQHMIPGKYRALRVLEVGSCFGCSTVFLGLTLKAFSEDNILFCMDTWKGSPNENCHEIANYENAFEHFRAVLRYAGASDQVKPIVCESGMGMGALKDDYFDIVFIDAAHNYRNVCEDIRNAIRIIRPGGMLIGHDCECKYSLLPQNIIETMDPIDPNAQGIYHVGVIKALKDIFGEDYSHFTPSLVWHRVIAAEDKKRLLYSVNVQEIEKIIALSESIGEGLSQIGDNANRDTNLKVVYTVFEAIDYIADFLIKNFFDLNDRSIKSMAMAMKDHSINLYLAILNNKEITAAKYCERVRSNHSIWTKMLAEELTQLAI